MVVCVRICVLCVSQDGDLDLYVTNTQTSNNILYQNDGSCAFTDVASSAGVDVSVSSNGGIWGDYDADGDVDLFVVTAASTANGGPNMLYQNQVHCERAYCASSRQPSRMAGPSATA